MKYIEASKMDKVSLLQQKLQEIFAENATSLAYGEVTMVVESQKLVKTCDDLKNMPDFKFNQLIDLCGVDLLHLGMSEWDVTNVHSTGYSRASHKIENNQLTKRYVVVYHLLSLEHNFRLRLKVFLSEDKLRVPSVNAIWSSANWYERECFDLYGVIFDNHPDLRRILTDYGFVGHPFRKDFPLEGNVEMHYDAKQGKCVYDKVEINNRTVIPKVIRKPSDPKVILEST
jgi:NADH-quinone oxidoreductase subunit C